MESIHYLARSEEETVALGHALGESLPARSVVALNGALGAGKTRLVRAIAASLGADPNQVTSPTFVLIQEYHGRLPIYHFDAYRVHDADEFESLGSYEYLEGQGVCLVEWAERVAACLPRDRLEIMIHVASETERRFEIAADGNHYASVMERLRRLPT